VVLGQVAVPDKTNELGAADEFLLGLVLEGRVVTADALLTQRALAQAVVERGGDYLLAVKDSQPTLRWDIETVFSAEADLADTMAATADTSQHGGRVETRRLGASTALVGYSDWPGLAQVLRLDRRVVHKATGVVLRAETAYAVTSLAPAEATPAQLLTLWREHWHIENKLHWVRDVTFDEDRSAARRAHPAGDGRLAHRRHRPAAPTGRAQHRRRHSPLRRPPGARPRRRRPARRL
jgi:predicted transposase YbfD/YdcC